MFSDDDRELLNDWYEIALSAGWWEPYENTVIICERPELLRLNDTGQLHCEDGPALLCRDGFPVHAWNGTRVPSEWIEDRDNLDPLTVLKTENVEQRAAGCAIVGWEKMLDHLDHRIVDSDPDPDHGDLVEVHIPGLDEPGLYLKALCPRNSYICEGVPNVSEIDGRPIKTVRAAQAWRIGMREDEFSFPVRRT